MNIHIYTQLAPPPPPPKGEGKSTKFKNIYDKSSFPSYHYTLSARPAMTSKKYSKYDV